MIGGACSPIVVANPRHMDDESRERPGSPKGAGEVERLAGEDGRRPERRNGSLEFERQVADLVEKQQAAVRRLDLADLALGGAGKRALPVSEQIGRCFLPMRGRTAGGEDQRRRELTMPCWIAL